MDYVAHFHREAAAFESAAWSAAGRDPASPVPSCPGWTLGDLVMHLGTVHRAVGSILEKRLTEPPPRGGRSAPSPVHDHPDWPDPAGAPNKQAFPETLVDWFAEGAAALEGHFRDTDPAEHVWTWSADHTAGFWGRMQSIEAAVHRWDAENALGRAAPVDPELAADAIQQTFDVMAPIRRAVKNAPAGTGERFRFRRSDGDDLWAIRFDGPALQPADPQEPGGVDVTGTASDLMLFLWRRIPPARLDVQGDEALLDRYFTLVPPI